MTNHPYFCQDDYDYLSSKGYTDSEIKVIWDRDYNNGLRRPQPKRQFWAK